MVPRRPGESSRREFVTGLTAAASAGVLGSSARRAGAESSPETTTVRIADGPVACWAPQYVAEQLLRAEGFVDVQYVKVAGGTPAFHRALASGEIDFGQDDAPNHVMHVDGKASIVVLAGIHTGCFELFGTQRVRSVRDLKGKTVSVPVLGSGRQVFVASMAAFVGLNPTKDITWVTHTPAESMRLFAEGKIDAFLGFPPEPQELRAKHIGHVLVNTLTDRPWSQYFCCLLAGRREFVRTHPVATKRVLRAFLKAADLCALAPDQATRVMADRGYAPNYDYTLRTIRELGYRRWRELNPEDTIRFYALRLREAQMIKSSPQKILAEGTDWRFLNELKKELKV